MSWLLELAGSFASLFPFLGEGVLGQKILGSMLGEYLLCISAILFFSVLGKVVVFFFRKYMRGLAKKTKNEFDDLVMEVLSAPLFWVFPLAGLYIGLHFLELGEAYLGMVDAAVFTISVLLVAWVFIRIVDGMITFFLVPLAAKTQSDLDDQLIPVLRNTFKASIVVMLLLVVVSHYGVDIMPALAGLGIGGLALAFAAKETIADIFGGISIFTSRPFKIGDWVKIGSISGSVIEVGLRCTRIRALDRRIITVPNRKVSGSIIENYSKPKKKMTEVTLGLTYDTKAKDIGRAMAVLRKIINGREDCEDGPLIVFKEFTDSSVNVMVRYWILKKGEFMRIRSEVNREIKKRFDKEKLDFAFPTQTIHLEK